MANFDTIKTAIDANINTNGKQEITGGKMNSILKQIVDATDEQLTELESETNSKITELDINTKNVVVSEGDNYISGIYIGYGEVWMQGDGDNYATCYIIKVREGDKVEVSAPTIQYAFLSDIANVKHGNPPAFVGTTKRINIASKLDIIVPDSAKYLYITRTYGTTSLKPREIIINGIEWNFISTLPNKISNIDANSWIFPNYYGGYTISSLADAIAIIPSEKRKQNAIIFFRINESAEFRMYYFISGNVANWLNESLWHPIYTGKEVDTLLSAIKFKSRDLYAEKVNNTLYVYHKVKDGVYIEYPLNYRYKGFVENAYPSYYDNWGIGRPALCFLSNGKMERSAYLFHEAEAELALNVPDRDAVERYVGGVMHGFENIVVDDKGRHICFLVDNQKVLEDEDFALRAITSIEVRQETELCQAYTNSNPFAKATKKWMFDKQGLRISTSVEILRDIFMRQSMFGMFGVYRHWKGDSAENYLTRYAIKNNNPYVVYDMRDGWESNSSLSSKDRNCTQIVAYGEMGCGFSMEIKDATTKAAGGMFVATNNSVYNKIYYDMTGSYQASKGEVLFATQMWTIDRKEI